MGSMLFDIGLHNIFFGYASSGKKNKRKNKQMGLHQTKKLPHSKEIYQQTEMADEVNGRRYLPMIHLIRG